LGNGNRVSPFKIITGFKYIPGIISFKLHQKKIDEFIIHLVAEEGSHKEVFAQVSDKVKEIAGAGAKVNIRFADEIPREKSGKSRAVQSDVFRNNGDAGRWQNMFSGGK
jgi:phenylacetate-CoA ligase